MIHTTRWEPDTCGCVVEYTWDDAVSADNRVHILKNITQCESHKHLNNPSAYGQVLDENTTKNKVHGLIMENFPDLTEEIINSNGEKIKKLKSGVEYHWSFDANRKLQVDLVGATDQHKSKLKNLIDTKIAPQKANII